MQNLEKLSAKGRLHVVLTGPDGAVKETHDLRNLVVDSGLAFIVSRMNATTYDVMSHMSLGEGTTAAAAGDTALESEVAASRVALDSVTVAANQITYVASFGAGVGTGSITESGIFNDAAAGTMLCRTVFPVVTKQAGDSMTVTWTITVQ